MKKLMIFSIIGLLFSCSTERTMVTGTWTSPKIPKGIGEFDNVLVAAFTDDIQAKSTVENDIANELRNQGVSVSKSIEVFPPNFSDKNNDKQAMLDRIRGNGIDAILTVSLINKETETRYVPGTYTYDPYPRYGFYGTFWGYYTYWYPRIYSPGYYAEDKIYYLETNLYDAETEKLIWSAQSETYNPINLNNFSEDFARIITDELEEDNVLM